MGVKIGTSAIGSLRVGSAAASKIYMGSVQVWAASLSLTDGLVAFWKLDDANDSSGNSYNLSATNVTHSAGKIGDAAYFDGTAYLTTSSLPAFSGTDMTIAGWFRDAATDTEDFLIGCGSGDSAFYVVRVNGDIKAAVSDGNNELYANGSGANDDEWHFFAVTRTATTKKIWLDTTTNSASGTYGSINSPSPFSIGSNFNNTYLLMNGYIDAVGLWDRALSDAEIDDLYNAGNGIELP